jgi:signal transduction histidine kinase
VSRLSSFARSHGFDLLIVIAAVGSALVVATGDNAMRAPRTTPWFAVPAAALIVLPLLGRRRWRFGAPVSVWLLAAAFSFADGRLVVFTAGVAAAGMASSFLLGQLSDAVQARLGLAVVLCGAAVIVSNDPNHAAGDFLFTPLLFVIAWLAGFALRERAAQAEAAEERAAHAEREREAAARVAVAEERARIARELHDIVAHAVSVMVLGVGAVRHTLPGTLDVSAYRIVQEGLTNALRHAHASHADVVVRYGSELRIDVRDDGRGGSPGDGLGHGLVGVRERVKLYGGEMTAGAAAGGGFLLSTRLPLDGDPR